MEVARALEILVIAVTLAVCVVTDMRRRVIPNCCVIVVVVVRGAYLLASLRGSTTCVSAFVGAVEAAVVLMVSARVSQTVFGTRGVGGGDVKLVSALGLCFGAVWTPVLIVLMSAFILAAQCGHVVRCGRAGWRCTLERAVPAAPAIALAAAATWGLSLYMEKL